MKNIYIIDDNEAVCQSLKFLFETFCNYPVHIFTDPLVFLDTFSEFWEGCLIIDLLMPSLHGMNLLKKLKKMNNKLPTIVVSGNGDMETESKVIQQGAYAFLSKPFEAYLLLEQVQKALESS